MEKTCTLCKATKPLEDFSTNGNKGRRSQCKPCRSSIQKQRYAAEPDKKLQSDKAYYEKNREIVLERNRVYRQTPAGKLWYENRKQIITDRLKERRLENRNFAMICALRSRLRTLLKNGRKNKTFHKFLSCSNDELVSWVEFQFTDDMSWETYGERWVIDHVIPIAFFDLDDDYEKELCFHWTNLKPLCKRENLKKNDSILPLYIIEHQRTIKEYMYSQGYQTTYESMWWPRLELGYGKNPTVEKSFSELLKRAIRSQAS